MKIYIISIFPEIFNSFLESSILHKAQQKTLLKFFLINPRDFCTDKHKQIDDVIYGGGSGMLLKAQPMIDSVNDVLKGIKGSYKIVYLAPSKNIFDQEKAFELSGIDNLIFVCGRYEGIDFRFEKYCEDNFDENFLKISLGKFVLMGGEVAVMTTIEAVARLIPGVIKEASSYEIESYDVNKNMQNLEYPQYTRPEELMGYKVPEILLSGNHAQIKKWRDENENFL